MLGIGCIAVSVGGGCQKNRSGRVMTQSHTSSSSLTSIPPSFSILPCYDQEEKKKKAHSRFSFSTSLRRAPRTRAGEVQLGGEGFSGLRDKVIMLSTLGTVSKLKRKKPWEMMLFDKDFTA